MPRDAALPRMVERKRHNALATMKDAAVDAAEQQSMLEAMRSRLTPSQEADTPLDDYDLILLGSRVVQIRINVSLASRDVLHQLRAVRRSVEAAIAILEGKEGTSVSRRILAKREMEAARRTVIKTRIAAGEVRPK